MKYRLLISSLILGMASVRSNAQWAHKIGFKKTDVISKISIENNSEFENVGTSSDGKNYLLYRDKERFYFEYIYYFDNNAICIADGFIVTKVNYTGLVTQFNHDYKLISDDVWEDDVKQLKVAIRAIPSTEKILVEFSKL